MKKRMMEGVERYFTTGVGLITSTGKQGTNVMAAEWTMQISYDPMLIAVFIHKGQSTYDNIMETREFGVNMSTDEQADLVNIAGGYSRKEIDKLSAGGLFRLHQARHIKAPMISGCIVNAECRVVKHYSIGDHTAIIGKVLHAEYDNAKSPLIYHRGMYRSLGGKISSNRRQIKVGKRIFEELERMCGNEFTFRCAVPLVLNERKEMLFVKHDPKIWNSRWTVPWFVVGRGKDHARTLEKYLRGLNLDDLKIGRIAGIERVLFRHGAKKLRANFVVFRCTAMKSSVDGKKHFDAKWSRAAPKNLVLKGLLRF